MSSAKARLEEELSRLETLLRLLDEYEETLNEQTLLLLSQKLKVIVPELRALSLDPQYKTPECAPLLVTLGQGVKNAVQRTRGITLPNPAAGAAAAEPAARALAEPKPLRGYLRKRGDKGLVRGYKLRYFEQRGEKIMYYKSDKPEDLRQGIGWIDLSKMIGVEKTNEANAFDIVTAGRIYHLMVVPTQQASEGSRRASSTLSLDEEDVHQLHYWIDGLLRYRQYKLDLMARMNNPSPSVAASPVASSPSSVAFSVLSEASEDERVGSALSARSPRGLLDSPASPDRPLPPRHPSSARRLNFDADDVDDDDTATTDSRASPPEASSTRASLHVLRASVGPGPPAAAVAAVSAARASVGSKAAEPVLPATAAAAAAAAAAAEGPLQPALLSRAPSAPEISGELFALKQALLVAKKEAADAKYLADIREKEVAAMKNDLRAKEAAHDRELERVQVLEEKLLARNARVQGLEKDLAAVTEELANRDLMITDLRAKARQALTAELARLVGNMDGGGSAATRQKDMVLSLSKELEHEREANEAHQQRVRFMATQLSDAERKAKMELDQRDVALDYCRAQAARLKERLQEARRANGADPALLTQFEALKREYFQALGVGMKLNLAMQGQSANIDLMGLYDQVSETLPFTMWNKYLSLSFALELNPSRQQAISAQLNALLSSKSK